MAFKMVILPPQTKFPRQWAERLRNDVPGMDVVVPEGEQQAQNDIVDADGAWGALPIDLLRRAQKLRWLQAPHAGPPAGFYTPELVAHPVVVTNLRGMYDDHIGAHIMSFVYAFARGLHRYIPQQTRREWSKPATENEGAVHLPEATALIVGLGSIGAEAARLMAAAGVTVIATDARRTDVPPGVAELHPAEKLDALLPRADFVILTVPHTPATVGFFHRERFQRMKKTAFFINIGRGKTTKLDDLVDALWAGEIVGAALDVYEIEPLPREHPLWTMPGVLLTPHVAASGPYLEERRYGIVRDNCRAIVAGKPLKNIVDKANWF